jgi:prophage antirepressor-like protein
LGLKAEERNNLLGLTAAVLNLGQLRFSAKGGFEGGSQVEQPGDVINESGLYYLILRSKLESVKSFKR